MHPTEVARFYHAKGLPIGKYPPAGRKRAHQESQSPKQAVLQLNAVHQDCGNKN